MHHAGLGAGIVEAGRLGDRQRVHIGAEPDRALAGAVAQRGDHAGAADAGGDLVAPAGQQLGDKRAGRDFLAAELGRGVETAAQRDEIVDAAGSGNGRGDFHAGRLYRRLGNEIEPPQASPCTTRSSTS